MDNVNILSQMNHYDFSSPINITMIFEEGEDEPLLHTALKENNLNKNLKPIKAEKQNTNALTKVQSQKKQVPAYCHESTQQNIDNKLPENSSPVHEDTSKTSEVNLSTLIQKSCCTNTRENIEYGINETCQNGNNKEVLDRNIKALLDTVSENLIMLIRLYHNACNEIFKKDAATAANFLNQFDKCKAHFFDLSYSTVVSLILPEEKNEIFVEKFLDKLLVDANKVLKGNFERKHVEPFYNEMIEWVKKKRDHIKIIELKCASKEKICGKRKNEHTILKQLLVDSSAFEIPNTESNVSKQSETTGGLPARTLISDINGREMTAESSICIFTAGDPEREISININPDLLQNQSSYQGLKDTQHKSRPKTKKVNGSPKKYSKQTPLDPRQRHYYQRINQIQQNDHHQLNNIYNNTARLQAPPSYYHHHRITSDGNLSNLQNIVPGRHNYQTQLNNNSSSVCNNANSRKMFFTQFGQSVTPVITNVTSLNPLSQMTYPMIGRCRICGKDTYTRCQKCNDFSYCSTLCQELDVGSPTSNCKK